MMSPSDLDVLVRLVTSLGLPGVIIALLYAWLKPLIVPISYYEDMRHRAERAEAALDRATSDAKALVEWSLRLSGEQRGAPQ